MFGNCQNAATTGTVTIELKPGSYGCTWFGPPEPTELHPRADERKALRAHRATRKVRAKAARKTRRRQRLRRS